jgi:hypothetical protein
MALSTVLDISDDFNADSLVQIDISGWDWIVLQVVGSPSGAIAFKHSNDSNSTTGATSGNALTAINFVAVQMTDLSSGTAVTKTSAAGLFKAGVIGRFFQLSGTSITGVTKILVHLSKIG